MKYWIVGIAALVVLGGVGQTQAVTYSDGGIHDITTTVTGPVYVDAGPLGSTTLNVPSGGTVLGGDAIGDAHAYGIVSDVGGIVNISGGAVSGGNASGSNAHAFGISVNGGIANLLSGAVSGGDAGGSESGNAHTYGIQVWKGILNMSGGTVFGGDTLSSSNNAHTYGIYIGPSGAVNISGGIVSVGTSYGTPSDNTTVHGIVNQGGILNITGGTVLNGNPSENEDAYGIHNYAGGTTNIYGTNFNLPYGKITGQIGFHLTGTLANGAVLDTWITNNSLTSPLNPKIAEINLLPIPEPSTFILFGMGVFGLLALAWRRNGKTI
jgi:hypothetical protein